MIVCLKRWANELSKAQSHNLNTIESGTITDVNNPGLVGFICSKSTIETLGNYKKSVSSY